METRVSLPKSKVGIPKNGDHKVVDFLEVVDFPVVVVVVVADFTSNRFNLVGTTPALVALTPSKCSISFSMETVEVKGAVEGLRACRLVAPEVTALARCLLVETWLAKIAQR